MQWGPAIFAHDINVDGRPLSITKSLDTAIRHLRHSEDSVMVWIDQICINQDDLAEKTTQVELMRLIYQRAMNTVIWLRDSPADEAFDALQTLDSMTHDIYNPLLSEEIERLCSPPYMRSGARESIDKLFTSPWFQRTWTIQEAVLSHDPWVMSGTSVRHWEDSIGCCAGVRGLGFFQPTTNAEDAEKSAYTCSDVVSQSLHGSQAAHIIWQISAFNAVIEQKTALLEALAQTRHAKVTNPLDKVYGVLGLCGPEAEDIVADYNKQAKELYRRIALKIFGISIRKIEEVLRHSTSGTIIHSRQPILLLHHIDHPPHEHNDSPSWVVDWSRPRVTSMLASSTEVFNCFHAGRSSLSSSVLQISDDEDTLRLSAKIFDTVEYLSPIINNADLSSSKSSTENFALRTCIAFASSVPPNSPARVSFQGFCQLLTAGKDITGRQKYPAAYTEILSFLCDVATGQSPSFSDQVYTTRQRKGYLTLDSLKTRSCGHTFEDLKEAFRSALCNRRLCWTDKGHLGLIPWFTEAGDRVIVVPGAAVPFVVRPAGEKSGASVYQFIGEAFVDRIVQGEVMVDDNVGLTYLYIV